METEEILDILDSLPEKVGNDEEIDNIIADLMTIKDWSMGINNEIASMVADVNRLNEKVVQLQKANNTLYRQIGVQEEKAKEAISIIESASELI